MLEWGLDELIKTQDRKSLRLVSKELRHAVCPCIDTIALPLDSALCIDNVTATARAHAMAQFHAKAKAAKLLRVQMSFFTVEDKDAASCFMATYSVHCIGGGLPELKRCHRWRTRAEVTRRLQAVTYTGDLCGPRHVATPSASRSNNSHSADWLAALAVITQLRTLTLGFDVDADELVKLNNLSKLECMRISHMYGSCEDLNLAGIRALSSAYPADDLCSTSARSSLFNFHFSAFGANDCATLCKHRARMGLELHCPENHTVTPPAAPAAR